MLVGVVYVLLFEREGFAPWPISAHLSGTLCDGALTSFLLQPDFMAGVPEHVHCLCAEPAHF
jgi:hypothetical protein